MDVLRGLTGSPGQQVIWFFASSPYYQSDELLEEQGNYLASRLMGFGD